MSYRHLTAHCEAGVGGRANKEKTGFRGGTPSRRQRVLEATNWRVHCRYLFATCPCLLQRQETEGTASGVMSGVHTHPNLSTRG